MTDSSIAALLSIVHKGKAPIDVIAEEKELSDLLYRRLGYRYQERHITYNDAESLTIFTVYGPVKQAGKSYFRRVLSGLAKSLEQRFLAFTELGGGAQIVTPDLSTVIELLDEGDSNLIVSRYSAWVLGTPFSKMTVSCVSFVSTRDRRKGLFDRIRIFFSRRRCVKRGIK